MFLFLVPGSRRSVLPNERHVPPERRGQALSPRALATAMNAAEPAYASEDVSPKKTEKATRHAEGTGPQRPRGQARGHAGGCHFTPAGTAVVRSPRQRRRGRGDLGSLTCALLLGTHTARPRGDSVEVPREFKMELPCERALPSLRGYPRETRTCPCNTVRDIHGGVVDNAQGQDGLGRPRGEAEHAMTFFCRKKERSTCAGAPGTPGAQRKKPVTSSHASWATV